MEDEDTEESKKISKNDDGKGCLMEDEDTEESKKTCKHDADIECTEGDQDIKPNFRLDWLRAFFAFWQSCETINCCNVIHRFLFLVSVFFLFFRNGKGEISLNYFGVEIK